MKGLQELEYKFDLLLYKLCCPNLTSLLVYKLYTYKIFWGLIVQLLIVFKYIYISQVIREENHLFIDLPLFANVLWFMLCIAHV